MPGRNFLLGKGESLTSPTDAPGRKGDKKVPYSFAVAQKAMTPLAEKVVRTLDAIPADACPNDQAVVSLILHPAYLAKSFFPGELLNAAGLYPVGSRPVVVTPRNVVTKGKPKPTTTTELFVAGSRSNFRRLASAIGKLSEGDKGAADIIKLEDFRTLPIQDRVRPIQSDAREPLLEVVLHAGGSRRTKFVLDGFKEYLRKLGVDVDVSKELHIGALCFLPVKVPREQIEKVAQFSFLRVAREMPRLRTFEPLARANKGARRSFSCVLPKGNALDPSIRVAILDGGIPDIVGLRPWVNRLTASNLKAPVPLLEQHGLGVTSAFLFGPIQKGKPIGVPYAPVDHYRVADVDTGTDPGGDLFDVLKRILSVIREGKHEFVALCVGPDLPVEDNDVHAWTAMLDAEFAKGKMLSCIAAGNSGARDAASGNNKIQPPADCVNALSVGACDSLAKKWRRAGYSSVGPGRMPGFVKPDLLAFGGCKERPFWVLDSNIHGFGLVLKSLSVMGTSFACPSALRTAVGVRAHLGPVLSPLALKALLVHRCARKRAHKAAEVGWGRILPSVEELITTDDRTARIVYQGELEPRKYLRARIPIPAGKLTGPIRITITICFASDTDPQDPDHYTRSGVEITFRPNSQRRKVENQRHPNSARFFQARAYMPEAELRRDAHKWETTLHAYRSIEGVKLNDPVIDMHHNARRGGADTLGAEPIPYAMIISVYSRSIPDFWNRVFTRYRAQLQELRPVIEVPIVT